ncbi:glycosyltransferase family 2 protein [Laspinema olomoucense]|uniref:glycosyltransferase family 2 protein n=1 Tax=Laspinema olomoucense TaxID=3231600 RepID=UPI0021BB82CC|nr:glycosyltransferase family 2 protein [Laspinema sp. D3a]MCT7990844.1 glycosyltransferase family 2 protein [Laspinema sp. D3a]
MINKESVYVIIPVHNRKALTLNCLEHLTKTGDYQRYHLLVVDDGSTDGTAKAIAAAYPDVTVLPGNGDLWWTGAIAAGMEYAYRQGAEYFIWLNDDCLPELDTLPLLLKVAQENPNTIAGAACYSADSNTPISNGFIGRKSLIVNPKEVVFVQGMSGFCVVIPRAVFAKIGLPEADKFPQYSGDDTYTLKATRSGFKACIVGSAKVRLAGEVRVTHNIQHYIHPSQSISQTFKVLFLSKKSPYYLRSRFFYHIQKYGYIVGALLFAIKFKLWLLQWLQKEVFRKNIEQVGLK